MNAASEKLKFTSYQVFIVTIIALTQFTVVLDFMIMSPLGDMLMKSMEMNTQQFGWVVSAYAFSAGISGILTAGFADRFDRKKLLLFFYIGFILGTLFCGLSHHYLVLILARVVTGIFGGVISSISMAIVADLFVLQQRGRVMGFVQMGFGASQVLGIPISLYIANSWGWQAPFFMIVGLALIIWCVMLAVMRPVNAHLLAPTMDGHKPLLHLWNTLKQRRYRVGFLATALLSLGGFMMMPFGSAFAINNLGVSQEQLPIIFVVSGLCSLIVMPLIGRFSDKINKLKIFTLASLWMVCMVLVYTNLGLTPFWLVVLINSLMMLGVMARMVPAMAMTSALPQMQDRGAFMSINSSLQQVSGGIAAAIGALIVHQDTPHSPLQHFDWVGYCMLLIVLFNIYTFRRVSRSIAGPK
ncbi:MAG: MFS transporter [Chitinophagaceae bacterium]|nr:MFS transporter [Chitinophagaceae bacterium]